MFEHFRGDWAYAEPNFFDKLSKNFLFQNLHFGPIRWVPRRFLKISMIYLHFSLVFLSIVRTSKIIACVCWAYAETILSHADIHGTDFIVHWAYEERISVHDQPAEIYEQFLHVQSMLSIRGTNFIAHWAYAKRISSHAEHTTNRFHCMLSMRANV